MELLLAYAPIVVWPDGDGEFTAAERTVVDTFWDRLPHGAGRGLPAPLA